MKYLVRGSSNNGVMTILSSEAVRGLKALEALAEQAGGWYELDRTPSLSGQVVEIRRTIAEGTFAILRPTAGWRPSGSLSPKQFKELLSQGGAELVGSASCFVPFSNGQLDGVPHDAKAIADAFGVSVEDVLDILARF